MTTEPVQSKIRFVLEKYDIFPKENVSLCFFSMANEVFFIKDSKKNKFVLKNCMKNNSFDLLNTEIELMKHLNNNGCRCPEVVPDKKGNSIIPYNGDYFILYKYLEGEKLDWNKKVKNYHLSESAAGLAKYHKAVASLDKNLDTARIKSYQYEKILEWAESLKKVLTDDKSGRPSFKTMLEIIEKILFYAKFFTNYISYDAIDKLENLMIHGDFHPWNCSFKYRKFYSCYDFDFIRRDLKIFDVSWALMILKRRFYIKHFGNKVFQKDFIPPKEDFYAIETKVLQWFIERYRNNYTISDEELYYLPAMEIAKFLFIVRFFKPENSEEECVRHTEWFKKVLSNLNDAYEDLKRITESTIKYVK